MFREGCFLLLSGALALHGCALPGKELSPLLEQQPDAADHAVSRTIAGDLDVIVPSRTTSGTEGIPAGPAAWADDVPPEKLTTIMWEGNQLEVWADCFSVRFKAGVPEDRWRGIIEEGGFIYEFSIPDYNRGSVRIPPGKMTLEEAMRVVSSFPEVVDVWPSGVIRVFASPPPDDPAYTSTSNGTRY